MKSKIMLWPVYFYHEELLKGKKMVFAENSEMAITIGKCIVSHDLEEWGVPLIYSRCEVGLPTEKIYFDTDNPGGY